MTKRIKTILISVVVISLFGWMQIKGATPTGVALNGFRSFARQGAIYYTVRQGGSSTYYSGSSSYGSSSSYSGGSYSYGK